MQHSNAAAPALAALPVLQFQAMPSGFQSASQAAILLHPDVQSLQQAVLPGHAPETEQLEADKQAIYRHPLFPLLASLFEKCEKATTNIDSQVTNESFNIDIETFVRNQEAERRPFFSDDSEVDNLMVKAIQVLRIHLLELEKVNDLCKDFCLRYIACLRGKLSSSSLLKSDSSSDTEDSESHGNSCTQDAGTTPAAVCLGQGSQLMSGGTVFQMVQTSQGLVAQPLQIQTAPALLQSAGSGSAGMQLAHFGLASPGSGSVISSSLTSEQQTLALASLAAMDDDDDDMNMDDSGARSVGGGCKGSKSKRGVLPKQATLIMKSWLFQHIVHPYPTEDEKRQIASQTNLTLLQVNNWFINARRRILQPMLDASNPDQTKTKKSKNHGRPMQRFWPESMANLQAHSSSSAAHNVMNTMPLLMANNLKSCDGQLYKCGIPDAISNDVRSSSPSQSTVPVIYADSYRKRHGKHIRERRQQCLPSVDPASSDEDEDSSGVALSD